jgi:TonB-dependent SusC/RagA subfamily outer membrane receptor
MTTTCIRSAISTALFGLVSACAPASPHASPRPSTAVTAEDLQNNPNEPIEMVLQRKVPGLEVTRGSGGIAVKIRGQFSFVGEDAPLYVLNGSPFTPGPDGLLSGIDPDAIESIQVLKGAQAGMYGIQGGNGVIVITTKKAGPVKP